MIKTGIILIGLFGGSYYVYNKYFINRYFSNINDLYIYDCISKND